MVVRHGFLPERDLLTGIGPLSIKQPRVRDKEKANPSPVPYSLATCAVSRHSTTLSLSFI